MLPAFHFFVFSVFQIVNVCAGRTEPVREAVGFNGGNPVIEYFNDPFCPKRETHQQFAAGLAVNGEQLP